MDRKVNRIEPMASVNFIQSSQTGNGPAILLRYTDSIQTAEIGEGRTEPMKLIMNGIAAVIAMVVGILAFRMYKDR